MIHKPIIIGSVFFTALLFLLSCKSNEDVAIEPNTPTETKEIRILALGDSYTKGESVPQAQSFPYQLQAELEKDSQYRVNQLRVIAETGWTTGNLTNAINATTINDSFDLVTLLIGVNNQFQNRSIQEYEDELLKLMQKAIGYADNKKENVVVLSIPDYGATPFGASRAALIGKDIDRFNSVKKSMAELVGVTYIDITEISRKGAEDNTLVANDGLHPSGKMYGLWVEKMLPTVKNKLND